MRQTLFKSKTGFKFGWRPWNDFSRGWLLGITYSNGSAQNVIVNPLGYETILKRPDVDGVELLDLGHFSEKSLEPIIREESEPNGS